MKSAVYFQRTLSIAALLGLVSAMAVGSASANAAVVVPPTPPPTVPAAGTAIVNQASGTYTDAASGGNSYYTTSNTVTVTVQNAPGLTISGQGGAPVTSGNTVTDTFTVTNVGNGNGTLQIASENLQLPVGATGTPAYSYTVLGPDNQTPVSGESNLSMAALNALGGGNGISMTPGQHIEIQVSYVAPYAQSTSLVGTATAGLTATITQAARAANGNAAQVLAQSMSATGTATDTIVRDAQLKLYTFITPGSSSNGTSGIYTLETDGVNSGGLGARGSQDAFNFVGGTSANSGVTNNGIFVVQQVPNCANCTGAQSKLSQASTIAYTQGKNGYAASAANQPVVLYGHGPAGGPLTWNTTYTGTDVQYVGAYINCEATSNICLNGTAAAANPSDGGGSQLTVPNPAFKVVSTLTYPTGFHSSDPNAFQSISNGVIDGNVQNGTQYVLLGPTLKDPATNGATFDSGNQSLANELYNLTQYLAVTGASNIVAASAPASFGVLVGPLNAPDATGMLDQTQATGTPDTNGDFTAFVLAASTTNGQTASLNQNNDATSASVFTFGAGAPTSYQVENTIENIGTTADTFDLTSTLGASQNPAVSVPNAVALPTGWTVTFYGANSSNQPDLSTPITTTPSVASGATYNFFAVYKPPANAVLNQFVPYEAYVTATSHNSKTTAGANGQQVAQSDQTWHVMFVNGFVQMLKTVISDGGGCYTQSAGTAASLQQMHVPNVCPGSTLSYTVNYANVAPDPTLRGGAKNLSLTANNFVITDDGTTAPNNWALYSNGLGSGSAQYGYGTATDTNGGGYNPFDNSAFNGRWNGTNQAGSKHLEDHVGTLGPQKSGTLAYQIQLLGGNLPSPAPTKTLTPAR